MKLLLISLLLITPLARASSSSTSPTHGSGLSEVVSAAGRTTHCPESATYPWSPLATSSSSSSTPASASADATAPVFSANCNASASATTPSSHAHASASATPTASATDVKTSAAQRAVGVTLPQVAEQPANALATGHVFPRAWQALHPHLIIPQLVAWLNEKKKSRATGKTNEEEAKLRMSEVANLVTDIKAQFGFGHKTAVLMAAFVKYYYCVKNLMGGVGYLIVASIKTDPELTRTEKQEILNIYNACEQPYQFAVQRSIPLSIPADAIASVLHFPGVLADLIAQYTYMELGISIQDVFDNAQELLFNPQEQIWNLRQKMLSSCAGLTSSANVSVLNLDQNLLRSIPVALLPHCLEYLHTDGMNFAFDDQGGTAQRPSLRDLSIDLPVAQQELAIIARAFPNLRFLQARAAGVATDEFITQIIGACTRLEVLTVGGIPIAHPELTRRKTARAANVNAAAVSATH